jgi:hypothetical protein
MQLSELNKRIEEAVIADKYIEAFVIKSLYVEGVLTVLSIAISAHGEGYDGEERSFADAVETEPETKKLFRKSIGMRLSEKIKIIRESGLIEDDKQADYLHTWKDKYRDEIFHNFAELMLRSGEPDSKSREGYEFMKKFTEEEWFQKLEEAFTLTEANLAS